MSKQLLGIEKKKMLNGYRSFFFCFLSSKASVRHSKVRFSFLKVFFRSTKTHGIWQALLMNIVPWPFVSCLGKLVWKKLVTNNNHTKFLFDTKTISFWSKKNKKNFPHRQKMERSGFKWFPHLSRYVAPFREVLIFFLNI